MNATEAKAEADQQDRRIGALLATHPDGKLLVEVLEKMYYKGDRRGKDPYDSYFNLGQRDVAEFLMGLRDKALGENK